MPETQTHTHTLGICIIYFFSTATMVTRIRLNVMFIRTLPVWWRSGTFRLLKTYGSYGDVDSDSSPLGRYAVIINSHGVRSQRT